MAYTNEVIASARRALEEKRQAYENARESRTAEIYKVLPQVREMDQQMRTNMIRAVQQALAGGEAAIDRARMQNRTLEANREALIRATLGEAYLDQAPLCLHCGGAGYVGTQMCVCLEELCRQEQGKQLRRLAREGAFEEFDLSLFSDKVHPEFGLSPRSMMERLLKRAKSYAATFDSGSDSLLFTGDTGLGKTFLSACIAKAVAQRGFSVGYESAPHLLEKLQKAKFSDDPQDAKNAAFLAECDLLVIDDLGTEMVNQSTRSNLYVLVNDRLQGEKPTIISSNLRMQEFEQRYGRQVASRLLYAYTHYPFIGTDLRKGKI